MLGTCTLPYKYANKHGKKAIEILNQLSPRWIFSGYINRSTAWGRDCLRSAQKDSVSRNILITLQVHMYYQLVILRQEKGNIVMKRTRCIYTTQRLTFNFGPYFWHMKVCRAFRHLPTCKHATRCRFIYKGLRLVICAPDYMMVYLLTSGWRAMLTTRLRTAGYVASSFLITVYSECRQD